MANEIETTETNVTIPSDVSENRRATLEKAIGLGADQETIDRLASALRVSYSLAIKLPGRFMGLSRSRGWCRQGRNESAKWGELDGSTFRVTSTGKWLVYSSDGFRREARENWTVEHIAVGPETWTIAY